MIVKDKPFRIEAYYKNGRVIKTDYVFYQMPLRRRIREVKELVRENIVAGFRVTFQGEDIDGKSFMPPDAVRIRETYLRNRGE